MGLYIFILPQLPRNTDEGSKAAFLRISSDLFVLCHKWRKKTCPLMAQKICLLVPQEDMSSCAMRRLASFCHKKTCFFCHQKTCPIVPEQGMSSCVGRADGGPGSWNQKESRPREARPDDSSIYISVAILAQAILAQGL